MAAKVRFINPEKLAKPPSYTHVVEVTGPGRTVYVSGQLGAGRDGQLVGEFREQAVQVYENLTVALAAVGATFADVVKLNSYLSDIGHLPILRDVRARYLSGETPPASTTLEVSKFAREGALLEIEAVAVLSLARTPARKRAAARKAAKARTKAKSKVSQRRKAR